MSVERPAPKRPAKGFKKPADPSQTKWDKWYIARAEEQAQILFVFKEAPFDGLNEDAIAKVLVTDRYGLFLQFAEFSGWVAKENIIACRTWTGS